MDEKNSHKKKIGSRIKIIRNELGLTMNEFGEKFNPPASDSIVSRWERGISSPKSERLKKIAELGNVSTFYLTTGKKAVLDLSADEKGKISKSVNDSLNNFTEDNREYINKEIERIRTSKLDFVETVYLIHVLNFLKYSDKEDALTLTDIIILFNRSIEINEDDSFTQEELNNFIDRELKGIEESLRKRFNYQGGE